MKPVILTLKKKIAAILLLLLILVLVLFFTALNQFKIVRAHASLYQKANNLVYARQHIDSLQNQIQLALPVNLNYFKTGQSKLIDEIKGYNIKTIEEINKIANDFYLKNTKSVNLKAFYISQILRNYNETLDKYTRFLYEKGFEQYGLVGQVKILSDYLMVNFQEENNTALIAKLKEIILLKDKYLKEKDPVIISKISILTDEAKVQTIVSVKKDKATVLLKLQKLEELIKQINQIDETIGYSTTEGVSGTLKITADNYHNQAFLFKKLIERKIDSAVKWAYIWVIAVFVLLILTLALLFDTINKQIHKPLRKLTNFLEQLVKGKLPEKLRLKGNDEISVMARNLNDLTAGLRLKAEFAMEIGKRNQNTVFQTLSDDDILGNALIEMEKSLRKADLEDQKYKTEEKKRIWTNEGLARFGEILRSHNNDINVLADEVTQNLVKYLDAIQGALYFYNDDDPQNIHLDIAAAFAYDRKKFLSTSIALGEGLVGTVAVEKEKLFITDVPEDYFTIKSGLGDAPPRSILIMPLKLEDEMLGVVELASYNIFQPHEIDFVEKIGLTIASTITSVKINARTAQLLEQSQKQAEDMAEQEEEMRQNMEELRTTQEDFGRREAELQGLFTAVKNNALLLTIDKEGVIIEVNDSLINTLRSKPEDIIGRNYRDFSVLSKNGHEYDSFFNNLFNGESQVIVEKIRLSNAKDLYLEQHFTPIADLHGVYTKAICFSNNITEQKMLENKLELQKKEIEASEQKLKDVVNVVDGSLLRCDYNGDCKIIDVNENYCKQTGQTKSEYIAKPGSIYLKDDEKEQFEKIWNEVSKNKNYVGAVKRTKPTGEEFWLMASFAPVCDASGKLLKVSMFALDITEKKLKYQLLEEANKEIERLKKPSND